LPCSCSKVFLSDWGKIFSKVGLLEEGHILDLPNAAYGLAFFGLVAIVALLPVASFRSRARFVFWISVPTVPLCLVLAYVLAFVLEDVCIVCCATYLCNFFVLWLSYRGSRAPMPSAAAGAAKATPGGNGGKGKLKAKAG
ncbi:unnamed protein product, partial [Phaeothamnion confervicola]